MHVPRKNLRFRVSRRPEQRFKPLGLEPLGIDRWETERGRIHRVAVLAHLDNRREFPTEYVGIAVGCETHDLGGIVGRKAEMNARLLPQEPQGVWIRERLDGLNPRAIAPGQ